MNELWRALWVETKGAARASLYVLLTRWHGWRYDRTTAAAVYHRDELRELRAWAREELDREQGRGG